MAIHKDGPIVKIIIPKISQYFNNGILKNPFHTIATYLRKYTWPSRDSYHFFGIVSRYYIYVEKNFKSIFDKIEQAQLQVFSEFN